MFRSKKSSKILTASELLRNSTNIYRTEQYIVKQQISVSNVIDGNTVMISDDIFYVRTPIRDRMFEKLFESTRRNLNGKRIKTALQTRQYVE
ncbi:MAG: hypothetical protein IJZ29_01150 [Clostridia bacterium]|nr:hypothetical protein [Clostridia bacterium]